MVTTRNAKFAASKQNAYLGMWNEPDDDGILCGAGIRPERGKKHGSVPDVAIYQVGDNAPSPHSQTFTGIFYISESELL